MSWFTEKSMSRQQIRFAMNEQKKINEDLRRQRDYQEEVAKGRKIKEELKKESFKNSGIGKIVSGMQSWASKVDVNQAPQRTVRRKPQGFNFLGLGKGGF